MSHPVIGGPLLFRFRRSRPIAVAVTSTVLFVACSSGGSAGDPATFCAAFGRLSELVRAAEFSPEEIEDVAAARSLADDIATTARALPPAAPTEVRDEVEELADLTIDMATELRDFYQGIVDDPTLANDPAYLASFEPVGEEREERLAEAGQAVRPFVDSTCADDLPPAEPTDGTQDTTR